MYTIPEEENQPLAVLDTYLAMVVGSIGSNQYRNLYVGNKKTNNHEDVIQDGDLACAYYVSSLLYLMNLINKGVHSTVPVTESDMVDSGWKKIDSPRAGAVVVWEGKLGSDGAEHKHIGFCLDENDCVSNSPEHRAPKRHCIFDLSHHDGTSRGVEAFYFHPDLK